MWQRFKSSFWRDPNFHHSNYCEFVGDIDIHHPELRQEDREMSSNITTGRPSLYASDQVSSLTPCGAPVYPGTRQRHHCRKCFATVCSSHFVAPHARRDPLPALEGVCLRCYL